MRASVEIMLRAGDLSMRRNFDREVESEADGLALFDRIKEALDPLFAEDPPPDE